ncbi:uncharacterized protein LOC130733290 isoform X2 [Lotus japonicus]|uniref:uncharacterized protein LOC130733290 isoform X2 n=1 Tax=Lotus japonicus TaxID=34305 RepID=UPI00258A8165|nr:uncharacterized protein LOC130733290 isoform X2 [Lotus japonicus]
MESGRNSRCAACKILRRNCTQNCVFAPLFEPHNKMLQECFQSPNIPNLFNNLVSEMAATTQSEVPSGAVDSTGKAKHRMLFNEEEGYKDGLMHLHFMNLCTSEHGRLLVKQRLVACSSIEGVIDIKTCKKNFKDWFKQIRREPDNQFQKHLNDFITLMNSPDFRIFCYNIYQSTERVPLLPTPHVSQDTISLRSSDKVVFEMNKMVAISESKLLKDVIECHPNEDEIPVPRVSSLVLPEVISFCEKKLKFDQLFKSIGEILKTVFIPYQAWVTRFVNNNHSIFSHLHDAANFLNIPSLFEFTSLFTGLQDRGENENKIQETSKWYSASSMLSTMGIDIGEASYISLNFG